MTPQGTLPLYLKITPPRNNQDLENDPPAKWPAPLTGNK